jgi:hypothetical protein
MHDRVVLPRRAEPRLRKGTGGGECRHEADY